LLQTIEKETGANPSVHHLDARPGRRRQRLRAHAARTDLAGLPAIRFIFPNADTMPVTINGGYVMRAWYDIVATDLGRQEDEAGLRASQAKVEALIAREKARGIPASASSWPASRKAAP
jgi:phospholipase/carboxylesterase